MFRFRRDSIGRFAGIGYGGLFVLLNVFCLNSSVALVSTMLIVTVGLLSVICRFNYLHPGVAYTVPWITILFFSLFPLSEYARPLNLYTYELLICTTFIWLLATAAAPVSLIRASVSSSSPKVLKTHPAPRRHVGIGVAVAFMILYGVATINVIASGYVPIVSLLTTGDSRYFEFGIHGLSGAFYAYANALGCLVFYLSICTNRRKYFVLFLSVICIHLAFMTRQNLITLLVEVFVIGCFLRGQSTRVKVILMMVAGLVLFSIIGESRSGNIKELVKISAAYNWIPVSAIWLYAYSYFNVINLENMLIMSGAPYYDGTMWQGLLPSIFRSTTQHGSFLELPAMTVSSYINPVYLDVGLVGVLVLTGCMGILTTLSYRRAIECGGFAYTATYACLFFCALLSFFVNFWFYLPVIFQLIFFWILDVAFFAKRRTVIGDIATAAGLPKN